MTFSPDYVEATGDLSQGEIVLAYFAFTRLPGESPPGSEYDPVGMVPPYPDAVALDGPNGVEVGLAASFGVVVTHGCELDRQMNRGVGREHWDARVAVAPIVGRSQAPLLNWDAIERDQVIGQVYLPPVEAGGVGAGAPAQSWPGGFADLRSISVTSRLIAERGRLMGIGPGRLVTLQHQLQKFFVFRVPSSLEVVETLKGATILDVLAATGRYVDLAIVTTAGDAASLRIKVG